ncbi:MAG: HSP90 family protein [Micromonosporaceae bacterium]|nr:HSP90 family protein [Micromonosporaceae bacterium]
MEHRFQVDLRGLVDLLSHHLYTSPRVYARELLQNAVDAITARRQIDPAAPAGSVEIEPMPDGSLRVHDNGIGLSEPEVHTFLASVGRTSKRDELGLARQDFLGQFGIGLLACFMVAESIDVTTRSARGGDPVRWTGYGDGRYTIEPAVRDEPGTTIALRPRPGCEQWLAEVEQLTRSYGHLLPVAVTLRPAGTGPAGTLLTGTLLTEPAAPWEATGARRRDSLLEYGTQLLGSRPLDVLDLAVPEADLRGVGFVLAVPSATDGGGHRVYLKRMLLSEDAGKLLPEWAFFVRCVVDTGMLRPTASREALHEDDLLASTRQALGDQVRTWLLDLSATNPDRLAAFLRVHHLGVKALAVRDDEMLRLVEAWLPMETSRGQMPLRAFRQGTSTVRYVSTVEEFRSLAAIAAAAGTPIVNAGYAYDTEILERLPRIDPRVTVRCLDPGELAARFEHVPPGLEATLAGFLDAAGATLAGLGCVPLVRQFDPVTVPALYLVSQDARSQDQLRREVDGSDPLWTDVLSAFQDVEVDHRPQLVLNWRHPLVRRIAGYPPGPLLRHAVEALYGQALLAGHHPLRAADEAALNRSFLGLLDQAFAEDRP